MTVVGFNFTKISAKRKNVVKGKINIANNISVTNVEKANLSLCDSKQEGLKFRYKFECEF